VKIIFSTRAWDDFVHWQAADTATARKIINLITDIKRDPFRGLGKPEPLRGNYSGFWSRRITEEHRLVYRLTGQGEGQGLEIAQCRYHYQ